MDESWRYCLLGIDRAVWLRIRRSRKRGNFCSQRIRSSTQRADHAARKSFGGEKETDVTAVNPTPIEHLNMPYEQHYVSAPENMNLPVLKEEPDGKKFFTGQIIALAGEDKGKSWYHCRYCEGWIEGTPSRFHESTLGPLCGRQGWAEHCIRCGNEIDFSGSVS